MRPPVRTKDSAKLNPLVLWLFVLAVFAGGGALWALDRMRSPQLTVDLGHAPAFELTAHTGEPFSLGDLDETLWMVDFFFTRCRGICPTLTSRMLDLQDALAGRTGWKLVSITVDPEYDTPEVLSAYAAERGADLTRWVFLTGEKETVRSIITEGFLLPVQDDPGGPEPVLHSSRILLVDGDGKIRGLYDALDEESMAELEREALALVPAPAS